MAIISDEEIEYRKSTDPSKYDVTGFKNTHYTYSFPYEVKRGQSRHYNVHDLELYNGEIGSSPFLTLHSSRLLTVKESYEKLSVSLALFSLFEKEGFKTRPVSAIGGYFNNVIDDVYTENVYTNEINKYIDQLYASNNSFQIQSRFTLSRAHSLMFDPESAIIEFFKVVELFIKNAAYTNKLSKKAKDAVFQRFQIFDVSVKESIIHEKILEKKTVEVIWKMKNIRNRFVGHGSIRPTVADLFDDPENNKAVINYEEFQYDSEEIFGELFYEKVMYDIEVIAVIAFCKTNEIEPVYLVIPGCWWQPSEVIGEIQKNEGTRLLNYGNNLLE